MVEFERDHHSFIVSFNCLKLSLLFLGKKYFECRQLRVDLFTVCLKIFLHFFIGQVQFSAITFIEP